MTILRIFIYLVVGAIIMCLGYKLTDTYTSVFDIDRFWLGGITTCITILIITILGGLIAA